MDHSEREDRGKQIESDKEIDAITDFFVDIVLWAAVIRSLGVLGFKILIGAGVLAAGTAGVFLRGNTVSVGSEVEYYDNSGAITVESGDTPASTNSALEMTGVAKGAKINHHGDLRITGSVGDHAQITVTGGSLIIDGNVGNKAVLKNNSQSGTEYSSNSTIVISNNDKVTVNGQEVQLTSAVVAPKIIINGNVGDESKIYGGNASVEIKGIMGSNTIINTDNGLIKTGSVSAYAQLESDNGAIQTGKLANDVIVKTGNGGITTGNLGTNCTVTTGNGAIRAGFVGDYCTLNSNNGSIHYAGRGQNVTIGANNGTVVNTQISLNTRAHSGR